MPIAHGQALLTDFYQLTMAYGYFRGGLASTEAVFHYPVGLEKSLYERKTKLILDAKGFR